MAMDFPGSYYIYRDPIFPSYGKRIDKNSKISTKQQNIDFFGMHLKEYIIYREQFKQSIKFGCFLNCGGICIKDKIMQRKN